MYCTIAEQPENLNAKSAAMRTQSDCRCKGLFRQKLYNLLSMAYMVAYCSVGLPVELTISLVKVLGNGREDAPYLVLM